MRLLGVLLAGLVLGLIAVVVYTGAPMPFSAGERELPPVGAPYPGLDLEPGDRLESVNGIPVADEKRTAEWLNALVSDEPLEYVILKADGTRETIRRR